jgi:hypothetical protein
MHTGDSPKLKNLPVGRFFAFKSLISMMNEMQPGDPIFYAVP